MIAYTNTIERFHQDVIFNQIADKIEEGFRSHGFAHNNDREHRAFQNSMTYLDHVFDSSFGINKDLWVAIEFQIPLTSKRIDFIISGRNDNNQKSAVIIELKQWDDIQLTDKDDIVRTWVAGALREEPHPSYQAYTYAKTMENFNEAIETENIHLIPCAYLHNFSEQKRNLIENRRYYDIVKVAPVFLQADTAKLAAFIKKYVTKPDSGNVLYCMEKGKIRPSLSLQTEVRKMMKGNDSFRLLDEQKIAYESILSIIKESLNDKKKHTLIIKGGPGTGKSVIAVKLLSTLIGRRMNVVYTSKNQEPRDVYFRELVKDKYKKSYLKNLFKGSATFCSSESNEFDCILCDEAHRLILRSQYSKDGENQIKEIIHASRVSVFFIDEDQRVTSKDIGSSEEIKKWAEYFNACIHEGDNLTLASQFRCNGSDAYLAFIDNLLQIRPTANTKIDTKEYDIRVFSDPSLMREELRKKNAINNKSRMVAGYCWDWKSQNDPTQYDIVIGPNFAAKWNLNKSTHANYLWALEENSFDEIGCIHTCQGLEFDYIGVIIGKDLYYKDGKVLTDKNARAKTDRSLYGFKGDPSHEKDCDILIRNTYRTLLTRGQKGCYIYCEDAALREYIKSLIN